MKQLLPLILLITGLFAANGSNGDLTKSLHTDQSVITSLSPSPAQSGVYPDVNVEIVFGIALDEKHIPHNAVRLRQIDGKKAAIEGEVQYDTAGKLLRFVPSALLAPGNYELDVMAIKSVDKHENIKNFTYRFNVATVQPVALSVIPDPVEVDEGASLQLGAAVRYDDGSERNVSRAVQWRSADETVMGVDASGLANGAKEGQTVVSASYKGLQADANAMTYLNINGYRLPFEPDPDVNNATLLGVDANENGVRDDVERYLLLKYKDHHRIVKEIALQTGRAFQIVLVDPQNAETTYHYLDAAQFCNYYFEKYADEFGDPIVIDHSIVNDDLKNIQLNTKSRVRAYLAYDKALSGKVYKFIYGREAREQCDFDIRKLLEQ